MEKGILTVTATLPLFLALAYTTVSLRSVMQRVSDFMNMEIGASLYAACGMLLAVYGGYYLLTVCSCEKMIMGHGRRGSI